MLLYTGFFHGTVIKIWWGIIFFLKLVCKYDFLSLFWRFRIKAHFHWKAHFPTLFSNHVLHLHSTENVCRLNFTWFENRIDHYCWQTNTLKSFLRNFTMKLCGYFIILYFILVFKYLSSNTGSLVNFFLLIFLISLRILLYCTNIFLFLPKNTWS